LRWIPEAAQTEKKKGEKYVRSSFNQTKIYKREGRRSGHGYISSESLKCIDPPHGDEYLIRSSWHSEEDWKKWQNSEERGAIQQQIDSITQEKTEYRIYEPLVGGIIPKQSE